MRTSARNKIIMYALISILLCTLSYSLSFTNPPEIDNETQSNENVLCYWNSSVDVSQANVTWYNNSLFHSKVTDVSSPESLSTVNTKRYETWTCQVTISNATAKISQNASVLIKNSIPTGLMLLNGSTNMGNYTNLSEDAVYTFDLNASDYDYDTLAFSGTNLPSGSSLSEATGVFQWTPTYLQGGYNNVTFWVTDQVEYIQIGIPFIFFVKLVNDAPIFNPSLSDQNSLENETFEYIISATDEENNFPLNFSVFDDDGLIGNDSSGLKVEILSNTSARLYFQPVFNDTTSNHTIVVAVTDNLGAYSNASFILIINSTNHAPVISIPNSTNGTQNFLFTLQINATDLDINDTLNYSIISNCQLSNPWSIQTLDNSSNSSKGLINITLTNDHIICRNVTLSVTDFKVTSSVVVELNLTNINDQPVIFDNSYYPVNTINAINISNLTAYELIGFRYRINFTDPDMETYEGENLSINISSPFAITLNKSSGEINFTPNSTMGGSTFTFIINLSDDSGLWIERNMNISVTVNNPPIIANISNISIYENETLNITINASDPENGTLTYALNCSTLPSLKINISTGEIIYLPSQDDVGNHTVKITVTDELSTFSNDSFNLEIKNVNDPPILSNITFPPPYIVINHSFSYTLHASDEDLSLPSTYETLSFNITWINSTTGLSNLFSLTKLNSTSAQISFTPNSSQIGNYTISFNVYDYYGLNDSITMNFTVYNLSQAPQILSITPYGPPPTKFGWNTTASFPLEYTTINISENSTILFNHTSNDAEDGQNLTYSWILNGTLVATSYSYQRYFDYKSSGIINLTLVVEDTKYETDNFTWVINISDINRPVQAIGLPTNETITGVWTVNPDTSYLIIGNNASTDVFYDPDDDTDGNGIIDGSEYNSLTFNATWVGGAAESFLDITFSGGLITFTPQETISSGISILYNFTATDGLTSATVGPVRFNISYTPPTKPEVITVTKTKTEPRYYEVEVEKIVYLDIIAPSTVTLYDNNTAVIPIILENKGNNTLSDITLSASSDNEEIEMVFKKESFDLIPVAGEVETSLLVTSFRTQGTYEIEVTATVRDPSFTDKALIMISSIEKEEDNDFIATTKTKISFAKDLLSSNPKCLDLNEFLDDAAADIDRGSYKAARTKLDEIINTCRYLTSQKELREEKPSVFYLDIDKLKNNQKLYYSIIAILSISLLGVIFSIYYTNKKVE